MVSEPVERSLQWFTGTFLSISQAQEIWLRYLVLGGQRAEGCNRTGRPFIKMNRIRVQLPSKHRPNLGLTKNKAGRANNILFLLIDQDRELGGRSMLMSQILFKS